MRKGLQNSTRIMKEHRQGHKTHMFAKKKKKRQGVCRGLYMEDVLTYVAHVSRRKQMRFYSFENGNEHTNMYESTFSQKYAH